MSVSAGRRVAQRKLDRLTQAGRREGPGSLRRRLQGAGRKLSWLRRPPREQAGTDLSIGLTEQDSGPYCLSDCLAVMSALKTAETLRLALFSMGKVVGFGFMAAFVLSRLYFSEAGVPGGTGVSGGAGPPSGSPGVSDMPPAGSPAADLPVVGFSVAGTPLADLALLVGIPAGLFLLGGAVSLWEKRLREEKQAREKESMREALGRIPAEGAFRDDFGDGPRDSSGR
jgi:hypothetical protein